MRIVFMGTPEFSANVLRTLCENGRTPVAVVTRADKPAGRGNSLKMSDVKKYALEQGLEVLQPERLSEECFFSRLTELAPDIIIVVAYGRILPEAVLNLPKHGCINAHASLLPLYRGAAPMQRAIMDGQSETGVTVMKMDKGLDTGDMILKLTTPITENDTLETIHDRLSEISGQGILTALEQIENGTAVFEKQDDSLANYAEKITPKDEVIDFSRTSCEISRQIRALTPFPIAHCIFREKRIKITSAVSLPDTDTSAYSVGEIISFSSKGITVACGKGALNILGVFPESKRRMSASDFVNGAKLTKGERFE